MRLPICLALSLAVASAAPGLADEPRPKSVEFDTRLSFACREVTPKDFADANKDHKIVEASLRISANFAIDEAKLESVTYKLCLPEGVEVVDYLPKTELGSDVAGPIEASQKSSSRGTLNRGNPNGTF